MNNVKQIEILQHLKPYERIKISFELYDFARSRIAAEIRQNNPDITEKELLNKLNKRFNLTE